MVKARAMLNSSSASSSETPARENKAEQEINDDDLSQDVASVYSNDLDRLEAEFLRREELLVKVVAGKDPDYVRIVKEYEASMQKMIRQQYDQSLDKPADIETTTFAKLSFFGKFHQILFFEEANVGYATLLLYCIAHLSCWEISTSILEELTKNVTSQGTVHMFLLSLSLLFYRMSGGIFSWVDSETHHRAKLAMQRRLALQSPDAVVMDWFRRHSFCRICINTGSFYVCWFAVVYFQGRCLQWIDKRSFLLQNLPSANYDIMTSAKVKLQASGEGEYSYECLGQHVCSAEQVESQDFAYLASELSTSSYSQFMGDEGVALVSTLGAGLFYFAAASISILVLHYKLGHTFGRH
jgi:hypothetical protein